MAQDKVIIRRSGHQQLDELDATDIPALAYDASGAATAAVSTHAGLADPHPVYLTSAEGNAAYSAIGAYAPGGTDVAIADGGTGASTAAAAVDALGGASSTGTGGLVRATSPTLVTPALGTPASGVATNLTGTAASLTAGTVTTNANLTGDVTSSGNATTIGSGKVTEAMQVLADNTTQNASTTKHGYVPKLPNVATQYYDGTGAFSVPAGAGITDHTHAATGSGATGGGATLNPVTMKLPAAMGTTEGQVDWDTTNKVAEVYDGQRERGTSDVGWLPFATPMNYMADLAFTSSSTLAANGGSCALPVFLQGHMLLQAVNLRSNDTGTQRTWGWDLYVQRLNNVNAGENTLDRVAACTADDTFTPGAASTRTLAAASAPVYLTPGLYWLVIQCRHATNNFAMGATAVSAVAATLANANQAKTTTNPNGATLDFVAATWTKSTGIVGVALQGRVFGQTTAWGP